MKISTTSLISIVSAVIFSAGMFLLISALADIIAYNLFDLSITDNVSFLLSSNRETINLTIYLVVLLMFLPSVNIRRQFSAGTSSLLRTLGFIELLLLFTAIIYLTNIEGVSDIRLLQILLFILVLLMYVSQGHMLEKFNERLIKKIERASKANSVAERMASGVFEIVAIPSELILFLMITIVSTTWQFLLFPFCLILISRHIYQRRKIGMIRNDFTELVRKISYLLLTFVTVRSLLLSRGVYLELPINTDAQINHLIIFGVFLGLSWLLVEIVTRTRGFKGVKIRFK